MKTAITDLLNIKYPIFQGAMARVSDADLVSAVSNAGGLGILETGGSTAEEIKAKVEATQALTDKPFAVNIYLMNPYLEEVVDYLVEESGVKILTTGAGNPGKYMDRFKEAGMIVMPVVASVAHAKRMERVGADAVICEGMEAGGHIGRTTTMALAPQVVDAVSIPVVVAGGIADGRGLAAAIMFGAQGVQIGTRFLVAKEANVHQNFKDAVIKANDISTTTTGEVTGHPVRVLRNKMTKEYQKIENSLRGEDKPDLSPLEELGRGALSRAVVDGDTDTGSMMAGQIAGLVQKEQSCQEILEEIVAEAAKVYQARADLFS